MTQKKSAIDIDKTAEIHSSAILEGDIKVGAFTTVGQGTMIVGKVSIGHHCNIACGVVIRGASIGNWVHIYDLVLIEGGRPGNYAGGVTCKEPDRSIIGDGCWINHGATMHGSQLGDGAVLDLNACLDYNCTIGKGSIVTNGTAVHFGTVIPDNCIVEGVPARIIKENITDDDRRALMGLLPSDWVRYAGEQTEKRIRKKLGM